VIISFTLFLYAQLSYAVNLFSQNFIAKFYIIIIIIIVAALIILGFSRNYNFR